MHTPDDAVAFERALGCPVQPKASWNGISVPQDAWHMPLRRRDPVLRQVLETQANDILARLPARTGLALEVQLALTARVAGGDTRIKRLPAASRCHLERCNAGSRPKASRIRNCVKLRAKKPPGDTSASRPWRSAKSRIWLATQSRPPFIARSSGGTE